MTLGVLCVSFAFFVVFLGFIFVFILQDDLDFVDTNASAAIFSTLDSRLNDGQRENVVAADSHGCTTFSDRAQHFINTSRMALQRQGDRWAWFQSN